MKRIVSVVIVAALVGAGVWRTLYAERRTAPSTAWPDRAWSLNRRRLGDRHAERVVIVRSAVRFRTDPGAHVDFNSIVKKNQVIARSTPISSRPRFSRRRPTATVPATVLNQQAQVER